MTLLPALPTRAASTTSSPTGADLSLTSPRAYARAHRGVIAIAITLALVATGSALVQPIAMADILATFDTGAGLTAPLLLLAAVTLSEAVADGLQRYVLHRTGADLIRDVRTRFVPRALSWPFREHHQRGSGEIVTIATTDAQRLSTLVISGLFEIFIATITFIGALIMMATISLTLLTATAGAVALSLGVIVLLSGITRRLARRSQERTAAMVAELGASLSALSTLRAGRATQRCVERITTEANAVRDLDVALGRRVALVYPIIGIATQTTFLVVLVCGGWLVSQAQLGLDQMLAFLMYLFLLLMPMESGLRSIPVIQQARASWDRIRLALEVPTEDEHDRAQHGELLTAMPPTRSATAPAISMRDVRFRYADGPEVISGIDLDVRRGSRVALVGPSGSGKSTILALLLRLVDPDTGSIRVDGVDVKHLERDAVRAEMTYLEQQAPVIAGSIAHNLRLFAPQATDDELTHALNRVGLDHLLLRDGLRSTVGEHGTALSGGERQRLALARTLLHPARIVLMDEPTSQVDSLTERLVLSVLTELPREVTVVVVAHRLATVAHFDQIVHLDTGVVTSRGTHSELLAQSDHYRSLAVLQAIA